MLLRSLENKAVVLWWYACEHYTSAQLGNLTYDRTNDFSKGNPGTIDLNGALWFAVVCWGSGVRALCSLCYIFQSVFVESQDKNEKNQPILRQRLYQGCDGHDLLRGGIVLSLKSIKSIC